MHAEVSFFQGRIIMSLFSVFLIGVSLSMDAFAVSVAKGMCVKGNRLRCALTLAFWFGAFQALMPLLGWLSGSLFESFITAIDHWIAFILLALIGGNMIREAIHGKDEEDDDCNLALSHVLLLAVATSIDAFAVGITFAFLKVDVLTSIAIIGITTFVLCFAAVYLGSKLGTILKKYAGIFGGVILILIGARILIEHLFF